MDPCNITLNVYTYNVRKLFLFVTLIVQSRVNSFCFFPNNEDTGWRFVHLSRFHTNVRTCRDCLLLSDDSFDADRNSGRFIGPIRMYGSNFQEKSPCTRFYCSFRVQCRHRITKRLCPDAWFLFIFATVGGGKGWKGQR